MGRLDPFNSRDADRVDDILVVEVRKLKLARSVEYKSDKNALSQDLLISRRTLANRFVSADMHGKASHRESRLEGSARSAVNEMTSAS